MKKLLLVFCAFISASLMGNLSPEELVMEHWKLAEIHVEHNRVLAAIYEYTQAINCAEEHQGTNYYDIYIDRANMYCQLGCYENAVSDYSVAIE